LEVFFAKRLAWNLSNVEGDVFLILFFHFQIITTIHHLGNICFDFFPIIITAYLRLGGDFKHFYFYPYVGKWNPIQFDLRIFFQVGLVKNHELVR